MEQKVNIDILNDSQKQALVCMYYAMLPKTDVRYKQRMHDWEVLEKRFGIKKSTYRYAKDTFDSYFTGNGRKGWGESRDLKRRGIAYQEVFDLYKDCNDVCTETEYGFSDKRNFKYRYRSKFISAEQY